jgi:hypothetical protein
VSELDTRSNEIRAVGSQHWGVKLADRARALEEVAKSQFAKRQVRQQ